MRFNRGILIGFALMTLALPIRRATAEEFFALPVKLSLPVRVVGGGQIATRTLKEKDLVNLALGRALGSKVDKKTEILAVLITYEGFSRVVVFNPSQNGLAQVTTTVIEDAPDYYGYETAYLGRTGEGYGVGTGTVVATTLGTPALNGLLASTLFTGGGGKATGPPAIFGPRKISAAVKGIIAGRLHFTVTENGQTTTVAGFIVNGKGKVSGPVVGTFDDGINPSCGDGIVQAQLGEECEYSDDSACPGKCNACICEICGNNRIDAGEICDGTAAAVCDAQLPPVPCKADCTSCQF